MVGAAHAVLSDPGVMRRVGISSHGAVTARSANSTAVVTNAEDGWQRRTLLNTDDLERLRGGESDSTSTSTLHHSQAPHVGSLVTAEAADSQTAPAVADRRRLRRSVTVRNQLCNAQWGVADGQSLAS